MCCGMTVKMETVKLIGEGRENLTCFLYSVNEMVIYFFLADILFFEGCLRFG